MFEDYISKNCVWQDTESIVYNWSIHAYMIALNVVNTVGYYVNVPVDHLHLIQVLGLPRLRLFSHDL